MDRLSAYREYEKIPGLCGEQLPAHSLYPVRISPTFLTFLCPAKLPPRSASRSTGRRCPNRLPPPAPPTSRRSTSVHGATRLVGSRPLHPMQRPALHGGLPGERQHPRASSAWFRKGKNQRGRAMPPMRQRPARHHRPRLPAGNAVRGSLRARRQRLAGGVGYLEAYVADWAPQSFGSTDNHRAPATGKRVAIGRLRSGGTHRRRQTVRLGHDVTVYEGAAQTRRRAGVPASGFRLPKKLFRRKSSDCRAPV